jgi:ferritin-like metal-binding protein YciE
MKFNSLHEVLTDWIRDLYNAENQLVKALPKMAKAASSSQLRAAFTEHLEQTRLHVARLEQVCEDLGIKPKGKTCHAMKGLIEEGQEVMSSTGDPSAKDAALIGAAQKVEHYEMAAYGSARTFAQSLGELKAAELLQLTLDEEGDADKKLTAIAEAGLNREAAQEDDQDTPREDPLAERTTEEFDEELEDDPADVEEEEMREGTDDDSDAAAPTPRGDVPGRTRHSAARTVTRRGR